MVTEALPFDLIDMLAPQGRLQLRESLRHNVINIAQQITRAVAFLHRSGYAHGHLHARNVRFLQLPTRPGDGLEIEPRSVMRAVFPLLAPLLAPPLLWHPSARADVRPRQTPSTCVSH